MNALHTVRIYAKFVKLIDNVDDAVKIENFYKAYDDDFVGWDLHHRYGIYHSVNWLKEHDLYYHRPYFELIYLPNKEHHRLHRKIISQKSEKVTKNWSKKCPNLLKNWHKLAQSNYFSRETST